MAHCSDVPKKNSGSQHDRFMETARALGCDEDPAAFDEKLKVIARHKPKQPATPQAEPEKRSE